MTDSNDKETTQGNENGGVGVYICHCGGNISDHVDVDRVREAAESHSCVKVARTHMFMCSDPGQNMIIEDLQNGEVDRVVVASCAPSLHETTFRSAIERAGANPFIYEHANIREQVSWVHHGDPATHKASTLVAAAAAKAEKLEPLHPVRVDAFRHTTVIGAGIAGMKTAVDIARQGIDVALIEKTEGPGGRLNSLHTLAPGGETAGDVVDSFYEEIKNSDRITVYPNTRVKDVKGYVGNFTLTPAVGGENGDTQTAIDTGAIVMATGARPYTPYKGEYGYETHPQVITLPELIRTLSENPGSGDTLEVNGKKIRNMVMIHCVGSRQIPGVHEAKEDGELNEYCSRTCCSAVLHAANSIRETFPDTKIHDMYRDIRTYGRHQEEMYNRAAQNRVVFMRFEADAPPRVESSDTGNFPLSVTVTDGLTFNEEMTVPADLVVLATGVEPADISDIAGMLKLPRGNDGFLNEVHPKLRPVELPVTGVFLAGTCQAPMDSSEACNTAGAAAAKVSALLGKGYIELDPFVAQVDEEKCTGTGACVDACLVDDALELVETEVAGETVKKARVSAALCQGCGACVAVCPENAIEVAGWTLKQYEAMVDAIAAA